MSHEPHGDYGLQRDMARAIGLGTLGAYGRLVLGTIILVAALAWLGGVTCFASGNDAQDAADAKIEAAERRMVRAALEQHEQTLRALAAVKEAERARAIAATAVARAEATHRLARVVDDTTVEVRSALDALPTTHSVPIQITARMTADADAIATLKLTVAVHATAIADLLATIQADSAVILTKDEAIAARDEKIEVLERKANPRCGVTCNRIIGAGAVIVTAIVVNTVRNAFTGRRSMVAMSWQVP